MAAVVSPCGRHRGTQHVVGVAAIRQTGEHVGARELLELGVGQLRLATTIDVALPHVGTHALGEELGLLGVVAIAGCYMVVAERGLRIAARAPDEFQSLLAAGLTLVVVIQAALIMAANLRLVPLTGVTLPFVSYGGSSVITNGLVAGLLLALSDRQAVRGAPARASRVGRSNIAQGGTSAEEGVPA